jgi:hypothetical protein
MEHRYRAARGCVITVACIAICGCASPQAKREKATVVAYLGGWWMEKTSGPFSFERTDELDVLRPPRRSAAMALLNDGAVFFLVFKSDESVVHENGQTSWPRGMTKVARIVFSKGGKIVGDFRADG